MNIHVRFKISPWVHKQTSLVVSKENQIKEDIDSYHRTRVLTIVWSRHAIGPLSRRTLVKHKKNKPGHLFRGQSYKKQ
jgi:hypothetical protein